MATWERIFLGAVYVIATFKKKEIIAKI